MREMISVQMAFRKPSRQSFFSSRVSLFSPDSGYFHELAIHLSFLAFRLVCALFCELFHEIANQSLYTLTILSISFIFDSARNLTRKYRLSGKNGKTRDEKNDWRDGLRNAIYTLIVSLISPTFFHILVNLAISVQLAQQERIAYILFHTLSVT